MTTAAPKICPRCRTEVRDADVVYCPKDGSALVTGSESLAPTVGEGLVGRVLAERYRVLAQIGRGGMGAVYEAEHTGMRRRVALKVLRPDLAGDPTSVGRFRREAQAASRIASPNIVTLHDFGQAEDGLLYLAMELLDAESLGTVLARERSLPPVEAVRIATEIARALVAAHAAGVVHRDLKPENVMVLREGGGVKVVDFGIAKLEEVASDDEHQSAVLTRAGSIVGTPLYISPEAAGRMPVGAAGDLYSLGVILFEMLVGRPPFDDVQPLLVLAMHLKVPPELVREAAVDLDVPDELEGLIDELLAKAPSDRPPSAAAVVERLEAIASSALSSTRGTAVAPPPRAVAASTPAGARSGTSAPPAADRAPSAPTVTPSSPRSSWRWAVALGTVLVLGVVVVVAAMRPGEGARGAGMQPVDDTPNAPTAARDDDTRTAEPRVEPASVAAPDASTALVSSGVTAEADGGAAAVAARDRRRRPPGARSGGDAPSRGKAPAWRDLPLYRGP